jgi:hypothetical protein
VGDYLERVAAAGLVWQLPATLTDAALEALLFAKAGTTPGHAAGLSPTGPRSIASDAVRVSR